MFLRSIALALVISISVSGTVGAAANPATNHADYWGNSCTKTEMNGEVMTFSAPSGATKVIVKGGTGYKVYDAAPFTNLTAPVNPNNGKTYGISHVIVCTDQAARPQAVPAVKVTEKTKNDKSDKGGATVKPAVVTAASATTPERLPEVGAGVNAMLLTSVLVAVMGYFAHRRYLTRLAV